MLPEYLQSYMDAWRALSIARGFTVATGFNKAIKIPAALAVSEILTAADEYGLPRRDFLFIAQLLDQTYLAHELAS